MEIFVIAPYIGIWWISRKLINARIKKGDGGRLFGVIVYLIAGLVCAYCSLLLLGLVHPVLGLVGLAITLFILVDGIRRSLSMNKGKLEQEEQREIEQEKRKEELMQQMREAARKILEKGTVSEDEYYDMKYNIMIPGLLSEDEYDNELRKLLAQVENLRHDRTRHHHYPFV